MALCFIHPRKKRISLPKQGLVEPILSVGCQLATEMDPPGFDADVETPIAYVGSQLVETAALYINSKYVYPPVKSWVEATGRTGTSRDVRGALLILGHLSEGCRSAMCKDLSTWLPTVLQALQH